MNTLLRKPNQAALLDRILAEPGLVEAVRCLEPDALGSLIRHVGLEDCSQLVALATAQQLRDVFDTDLWKSEHPGKDEVFDPDRFVLWLEVLLENGDDFAAEKVADWPEDLVIMGVHHVALVFDFDALAARHRGEFDLTDKALESSLCFELDEFLLVARKHEGWDAVLTLLVALDKTHRDLQRRILERCCDMCSELIDDEEGLFDVLTAAEMLESDAAAEREDRRAAKGFVSPSAAKGFLKHAEMEGQDALDADAPDPITRAYFRDRRPPAPVRAPKNQASPPRHTELLRLLQGAEKTEEPAQALPLPPTASSASKFAAALAALSQRDSEVRDRLIAELAYLSNVLAAGHHEHGRPLRPMEAAELAFEMCEAGLQAAIEKAGQPGSGKSATEILEHMGPVRLFRAGWFARRK